MIIDDEPSAIDSLSIHMLRCPMLELVGTSTSGTKGLDLVNTLRPDLVFVDVRLGDASGLDLTRWIGAIASVILCTGHAEYAATSYDLNVVDYLLKPVEFERFAMAVQKITERINNRFAYTHKLPCLAESKYQQVCNVVNKYRGSPAADRDGPGFPENGGFLFVKAGTRGARVRIDFENISFVRAMNNYVAFHVSYGKVLAHLTLKEVEYRLPPGDFMRVQKSYIVSLKEIASLENNELVMKKSGARVPVSGVYKELFLQRVKPYEV